MQITPAKINPGNFVLNSVLFENLKAVGGFANDVSKWCSLTSTENLGFLDHSFACLRCQANTTNSPRANAMFIRQHHFQTPRCADYICVVVDVENVLLIFAVSVAVYVR